MLESSEHKSSYLMSTHHLQPFRWLVESNSSHEPVSRCSCWARGGLHGDSTTAGDRAATMDVKLISKSWISELAHSSHPPSLLGQPLLRGADLRTNKSRTHAHKYRDQTMRTVAHLLLPLLRALAHVSLYLRPNPLHILLLPLWLVLSLRLPLSHRKPFSHRKPRCWFHAAQSSELEVSPPSTHRCINAKVRFN